jgi:hypothetical protein
MAKQQQASVQDDMTDVMFPYSGVELTHPSLMGRPDSTPLAENVRTFEQLTGRGRGGSRPGIDKFIDEQVSGENGIQHLGFVVTTDGELVGWSFDGIDQSFPGTYGGIGFTEFGATFLGPFEFETPNFPPLIDYDESGVGVVPFVGGSGYAPKTPKNEKIVLNIDSDGGTEIHVTDTTEINLSMIAGDGSQLSPNTLAGKVMTLYADPSEELGDGEASTPGSVTMNVLVGSSKVQKIHYHGEVTSALGNTVAESVTLTINYVPAPRTPIIHWSNPSPIVQGTALSAIQLNATATDPDSPFASVSGEFTYDPPSDTVLATGDAQPLHVDFAPDDDTSFNAASGDVTIDVTETNPDVPSLQVKVTDTGGDFGPGDVPVTDIPGPPNNSADDLMTASDLVGLPTNTYFLVMRHLDDGSYIGTTWNWDTMRWES